MPGDSGCLIDGEVAVLDDVGRSDFEQLRDQLARLIEHDVRIRESSGEVGCAVSGEVVWRARTKASRITPSPPSSNPLPREHRGWVGWQDLESSC